jgi:Holliday junction resolvasome RuvABC endonuclease subunit
MPASSDQRSILSIDPGNTSGIVVVTLSRSPRLLYWQIAKLNIKNAPIPTRLVESLCLEYHIEFAVIEDQFNYKSIDSTKKLSRTSGRWLEACLFNGIPVEFVNPKTWQNAIFGRSARSREQLKLSACAVAQSQTGQALPSDAADAYCIGKYFAVRQLI